MLTLNENEKIEGWTITVRTTDSSKAHGIGRELSFEALGLDVPFSVEEPIDDILEEFYPCSWAEDNQ